MLRLARWHCYRKKWVDPRNVFSWIFVVGFRHICEWCQWFSISAFAESCITAGLEKEFNAQTSDEKLL